MKQRILVALVTALVFGAGFGAGVYFDVHRPLPPPPGFMSEFGGRGRQPRPPPSPMSRADLAAKLDGLRPQIETFQKRLDEINDQFEKDLTAILTPEQRPINDSLMKRRTEFRVSNESQQLTDDHLMRMMTWPYMMMFRFVSIQVGYDELNREFKFEESQSARVHDLLRQRRDRFIALLDSSPPPSLELLHLAPYAQRMGRPGGGHAPPRSGQGPGSTGK